MMQCSRPMVLMETSLESLHLRRATESSCGILLASDLWLQSSHSVFTKTGSGVGYNSSLLRWRFDSSFGEWNFYQRFDAASAIADRSARPSSPVRRGPAILFWPEGFELVCDRHCASSLIQDYGDNIATGAGFFFRQIHSCTCIDRRTLASTKMYYV